MPENIRKLPRRWRPSSPGRRARRLGHREHERVEHAGAGGVAREGRRDDAVHQEDAVAQAERRPPEDAHHEVAEALAEPALHDGARHEERDDDQQDRAVGEAGVGLGRGERPGEHGRRQGEHGGRQDRETRRSRPTTIAATKSAKRCHASGTQALGHRGEPDAERRAPGRRPGRRAPCGRPRTARSPRRLRRGARAPRGRTARPWIDTVLGRRRRTAR